MVTRFRLAPMSPLILILTLLLLLLPIVVFVVAFTRHRLFALPALFLLFISAWTWLWFRPTAFVVNPTDIEVILPLRRRRIRRNTITAVRRVDRQELRQETGWALRVRAGGLWAASASSGLPAAASSGCTSRASTTSSGSNGDASNLGCSRQNNRTSSSTRCPTHDGRGIR
jgi:hypothetical protein